MFYLHQQTSFYHFGLEVRIYFHGQNVDLCTTAAAANYTYQIMLCFKFTRAFLLSCAPSEKSSLLFEGWIRKVQWYWKDYWKESGLYMMPMIYDMYSKCSCKYLRHSSYTVVFITIIMLSLFSLPLPGFFSIIRFDVSFFDTHEKCSKTYWG